jgi:hypothetical protein
MSQSLSMDMDGGICSIFRRMPRLTPKTWYSQRCKAVALPTFDIQNSDAEGRPEERSTGHRHLVTGTREHLVVNGFDLAIKYSD